MRLKIVALMGILGLVLSVGSMASAAPRSFADSDVGFQGTRAELLGNILPQALARAGHALDVAPHQVAVDLGKAFNGSTAYQWSNTMVMSRQNGHGFTFTLPADLDRIQDGQLALGVLENGTVVRAFHLRMTTDGNQVLFSLTHPCGKLAAQIDMSMDDRGQWVFDHSQLLRFATVLYPSAAKGTFDPFIDLLEGVINMLYQVRSLINMAICAVNELINMFENLNSCGWGTTSVGGGAIAALIICTVGDIIGALESISYCF